MLTLEAVGAVRQGQQSSDTSISKQIGNAGFMLQEVHYNQHGLLLLQGQGIYRLGSQW